jgi:hypothetical protein
MGIFDKRSGTKTYFAPGPKAEDDLDYTARCTGTLGLA